MSGLSRIFHRAWGPGFSTLQRSLYANAMTTGVMAFYQLISVPILLHQWGADLYADWIVINAFAAYFQMADAGFNAATANEVCFSYARREVDRVNVLVVNNIVFVSAVFLPIILGLSLISLVAPDFIITRVVRSEDAYLIVTLLALQIFIGTQNNLLTGIFRAVDRNVHAIHLDNTIRVAEYATIVGGALCGLPLPVLVCGTIGVKVVGLITKAWQAQAVHRLELRLRSVNVGELRRMLRPSAAFTMIPLSNAIMGQAPVILANSLLGPRAVIMFTTVRTLFGFGRSLTDIIYRSLWPEATNAYAKNDVPALRGLHRATTRSALFISVAVVGFIGLFGSWLHEFWTKESGLWSGALAGLIGLSLLASSISVPAVTILQAVNMHKRLAVVMLIGAVFASLAMAVAVYVMGDISMLALSLVLYELLLISYATPVVFNLTQGSFGSIFGQGRLAAEPDR